MYDVMLDLECLDVKESAIVTAIGAVRFDRKTFVIKDTFHQKLRWEEQEQAGRTISSRTVLWWMRQSPVAIQDMISEAVPVKVALDNFAKFYGSFPESPLWGNGVDFDNVILGSLYDSFNEIRPWSYKQNRCFRTFKNEWPEVDTPARVGVHHNALDDALSQMYHLKQIKAHINNANV